MVSCAQRTNVRLWRLRVCHPQESDCYTHLARTHTVFFNRFLFPGQMEGMIFTLFSIALAAAETAIAIAIIINIYRKIGNTDIREVTKMRF